MDGKFRGFAQKKDEKINLNTLNKEVGLNPGDLVKYDREILKKINGCFSNENYGITLNKTIGRKLNKLAFLDEEHLLALDDANGVLCLHRYKDGRSELLDTINSQMISTSILVVSSGLAFITEGNTSNKQYRSVRIINNKLELGDLKNSGVIGIINQFIKQSGIVWAFIRNGSSFELSQVSVVDTNTLSFGAQTSIHTHVSGSIYSTNITVLDSNRLIFRCSTYVNPDNFIYAKVIDTSGGITVGATKTLYTFSSEGVYYHGIGGSEHIVLDSGKVVFPVFMASTYKLYICDIVGSEIQDGTDTTLSFTNGFAAHSENDSVWKTDDDKILLFGSVSSYRVCYALLEVTGETPSLIEDYYLHEGYSLVIYPSVSNGKEYFLQLASNNHGDYLLPVRYKDGKVYSISIRGSVQVANSYRHYDWIDDKYIIEISKSAYNTIALQVYETDGIFIAKAGIIPTLLTDVYIGDTLYPRVAMTDDLVNGFIFYESSTNYLPYYCPFVINPDKSVTLGTPVSTSTNVSGTHQEIVKIGNNTFLPSFLKTKIYSSPIRFKEGVWQLGAERVHIKSVTASYSKAYRFIEGEGIALFSYYDGTGYYATSAMVLTDTVTNFYIGEWPLTNSWGGLSSSLINDILGFYKDGSFYVITQSNDSTNKDFGMYVSVLPVQAGGVFNYSVSTIKLDSAHSIPVKMRAVVNVGKYVCIISQSPSYYHFVEVYDISTGGMRRVKAFPFFPYYRCYSVGNYPQVFAITRGDKYIMCFNDVSGTHITFNIVEGQDIDEAIGIIDYKRRLKIRGEAAKMTKGYTDRVKYGISALGELKQMEGIPYAVCKGDNTLYIIGEK